MKKIADMTVEEFKEVMINNGMDDQIYSDAHHRACFAVEDVAYYFKHTRKYWSNGREYIRDYYTIDFEVGTYCQGEHLNNCGDLNEFLEDCNEVNEDMFIFSEDTSKKLQRMIDKVDFYSDAALGYVDISVDKFECLDTWMMSGVDDLCKELFEYMRGEFEYHHDEAFEIALELDYDYYDNFFVDDDGKLYEFSEPVTIYTCNGKTFDTEAEMLAEWERTHTVSA